MGGMAGKGTASGETESPGLPGVEEAVIWCDEIVQLRSALQSSESYHPKKPVPTLKLKFDEDQSQLLSFIQEQYESIFTGDEDDIQGEGYLITDRNSLLEKLKNMK
jgi:hypothetical protein